MATRKSNVLGRGIAALMNDANETAESAAEVVLAVKKTAGSTSTKKKSSLPAGIDSDENGTLWVDPNLLKPNPFQPRKYFDDDRLEELTASVKQEGVLSPIIIEDAGDGTFYIIAGERRTRASRAAGLQKVPVQLRKYTDARKLEVALIENIQRSDLNPVEEAVAYYNLMELEGITQDEVAKRVGKKRSSVANAIRLLKLPKNMQNSVASGEISAGHARALLSVVNPQDQANLYKKMIEPGISVRTAESMAQEMNSGSKGKKSSSASVKDTRDPNYIDMETKFIEKLGTKVTMKGDFNKGSIEISYFSKEDLDRLYNLIIKE